MTPPPNLELLRGELHIRRWPAGLPAPFGCRVVGDALVAAPRLRRVVLQVLREAGIGCADGVGSPPLELDERPAAPVPPPAAWLAWNRGGRAGVLAGLAEGTRIDVVLAAAATTRARTLLVVRDTGAVRRWQDALEERGLLPAPKDLEASPLAVVTAGDAAKSMHWRARWHDLLVVDRPEQMPSPALAEALERSAAVHRLGFVDRAGLRRVPEWAAGLGSLLAVAAADATPAQIAMHLPLTPGERADYEAAFHTFLCAYDVFVACQPHAGFGTFVQRARTDATQRPALLAWHQALGIAAWNAAKAAAVADLVARHRQQRLLVFAPDRASTYAISRDHLIAPLTAELPRPERDATLRAFADGTLRALVGPRLLDLGVPEGCADVGVLVGGGFGEAQRQTRIARVARRGVVYELVAQDTVEVGRAQRHRAAAAATTPDVHPHGR